MIFSKSAGQTYPYYHVLVSGERLSYVLVENSLLCFLAAISSRMIERIFSQAVTK